MSELLLLEDKFDAIMEVLPAGTYIMRTATFLVACTKSTTVAFSELKIAKTLAVSLGLVYGGPDPDEVCFQNPPITDRIVLGHPPAGTFIQEYD